MAMLTVMVMVSVITCVLQGTQEESLIPNNLWSITGAAKAILN